MVEKTTKTAARQGTNKPPLTTILLAALGLCLVVGVALYFFAVADQPVGEEVGGAVQEIPTDELPEDEPKLDPSVDIIEPDVSQ